MNRRRLTTIFVVATTLVTLLTGCKAIGSATVRAPGTIDDSVVSIAPEPQPTTQANPYELPARPEVPAAENCFPEYGPNIFVWDAGDPSRDPNRNWVYTPSPDHRNEALVWHLEPRHTYTGYYLAFSEDDGLCRQYNLDFEGGTFAGGLAIDAKAWTYRGDVVTFAVITLTDELDADPYAPQTV